MQTRTKSILLLSLVVFIVAAVAVSSKLISPIEDDNYLTPIPYETIWAYKEKYPIDSKQEALIVAYRSIFSTRLIFTQGDPKVVSVEKMKLSDTVKFIGNSDERPGDIVVWLVVFKGTWQIVPPDPGDLLPLETGCIYVVFDANEPGRNSLSARDCVSQ